MLLNLKLDKDGANEAVRIEKERNWELHRYVIYKNKFELNSYDTLCFRKLHHIISEYFWTCLIYWSRHNYSPFRIFSFFYIEVCSICIFYINFLYWVKFYIQILILNRYLLYVFIRNFKINKALHIFVCIIICLSLIKFKEWKK